jgi:hypothetical protein
MGVGCHLRNRALTRDDASVGEDGVVVRTVRLMVLRWLSGLLGLGPGLGDKGGGPGGVRVTSWWCCAASAGEREPIAMRAIVQSWVSVVICCER